MNSQLEDSRAMKSDATSAWVAMTIVASALLRNTARSIGNTIHIIVFVLRGDDDDDAWLDEPVWHPEAIRASSSRRAGALKSAWLSSVVDDSEMLP